MIKRRNCSIDIFRYIASIMVVAIHTSPFVEFNPFVSYLFAQVLPRIAVPFFATTAGYFYISKLENGKANTYKYIIRLLVPYTIWSIIYFLLRFIENGSLNIFTCIKNFLIFGSEPYFWYFPAIIFATIFTTIMFKLKLKKILIPLSAVAFIYGCLGHAYYKLGVAIKLPFLNALMENSRWLWITHCFCLAFPFFICGYVLYKCKNHWELWSKRKTEILAVSSLLIFVGEIVLLKIFNISNTVTITFGLYIFVFFLLIFLLNHPLSKLRKAAEYCRTLANFTYYSHAFFITIIMWINKKYIGNILTETYVFFTVIMVTLIVGCLIHNSNNKYISKLAA